MHEQLCTGNKCEYILIMNITFSFALISIHVDFDIACWTGGRKFHELIVMKISKSIAPFTNTN